MGYVGYGRAFVAEGRTNPHPDRGLGTKPITGPTKATSPARAPAKKGSTNRHNPRPGPDAISLTRTEDPQPETSLVPNKCRNKTHHNQFFSSLLGLLDSEVTSDAIASQSAWIPRRAHPPSTLVSLFFRRLGRRWYISVGALAALGLTLGLAPQLGALAIVGFMSAWSIVGAAVGRAASFGRVNDDAWPDWGLPLIASVGTALLGAGVFLLVWKLSAIAVVLIIAGLSWASFKRSRPAQVDSMSMLDSGGFGVSFSPEVLHYIARGALGLGVAALALGY